MAAHEHDIVFQNVNIIDGTGLPYFKGDVAVKDGKISKVGGSGTTGGTVVECDGLYASPGFIDIHNHSELDALDEPMCKNYIAQGVTTIVTGNCGGSAAPYTEKYIHQAEPRLRKVVEGGTFTFADYIKMAETRPHALNLASLVGHGNIRGSVLGDGDIKPTKAQLDEMRLLAEEAMKAGAFGMSTGLIYDPGVFAQTPEIIEIAKVVARYGGLYASHIRNESEVMVEAVKEAIDVGRFSGCRVQISHHKAPGRRNWGIVKTTLDLMTYYKRFGVETTCDVYPCVFCMTDLYSFFPGWTREKGHDGLLAVLKDPRQKARLAAELMKPSCDWENAIMDSGFDEIIVAISDKRPDFMGKSVLRIANENGMVPFEGLCYVMEQDPHIWVLGGGMNEDDVRTVIRHPLSMIGSDGMVATSTDDLSHPRSYRAFTKALSVYARDEGIITVEEMVKKMTAMPAWKLGVTKRGLLRPGMCADLNIFDLWRVKYRSEYDNPHQLSEGMEAVMINGEFVIRDGNMTGSTPGLTLKK